MSVVEEPENSLASPVSAPGSTRLGPGLAWGVVGVVAFSVSLPATKLAIRRLDPVFVSIGRAVIAGALAAIVLRATRAVLPTAVQFRRLAVVSAGVVFGFPLFTGYALKHVPSAHGAVVIGILPAATAVLGVIRNRERPSPVFWLAAFLGSTIVIGFALRHGTGGFELADLMLLGAVACAAIGYVEGARLAAELGGARVICWSVLIALPLTVPITVYAGVSNGVHGNTSSWLAFAYLGVVSMFLGFFAWYRGLHEGGVARVSQVQLAQPGLSLVWAALLLNEHLDAAGVLATAAIVACVAVAQRARIDTHTTALTTTVAQIAEGD
jgi:drug/metabolite transporter (DMT)-like permease